MQRMRARSQVPKDPFHLVFIICLILGCGTLLSYNVLVSCAIYFNYQFYDYPNVMFIIVPVYSIPNLLFTILMIPFGDRFSWTFKILGCFIIMAILVLLIPFIVSSNDNVFHFTQTESYYTFLTIVALIGCLNAILQCTIVGFCGLLPTKYLQTLMGGMATSGILVCIIRIFSKISIPLTPKGIEKSGMIYFMTSAAISIICAISFYYSKHSTFVQHHVFDNTNSVTKLNYAKKLKRIRLSASPSNKDVLHRDAIQQKKDDWSDEELVDYHVAITSPIQSQISGTTPRNKIITHDTSLMYSPTKGTDTIQARDIQTVTLPILLRSDTPHTLARFVSCDLMGSPDSVSFISDDDILAPLQDNIQMNVKSYGALAGADEDKEFSSGQEQYEKEKQRRLFRYDSSKQKIVSLKDRSKRLPKYYVKHHRFNWEKYIHTFSIIKYLVLSIWLSMFITFLWFPGVVTDIPSSFDVINNDGEWMPIIMITEFNVVDYIGRQFLSSYTPSWLRDRHLWIFALARILTYPIFVAFYRGDIVNDYILHIVMIVSALSNGWVASLSFMFYPRNINKHQYQPAASIMTLGLISGILSGSCVALFVRPYI